MENELPFRHDRKGLKYLDSRDIKTDEIIIKQMSGSYRDRAHFFAIDGNDDYIIKDCTMYPLILNRPRNLKLLKQLVEKQEEIKNVDFPIAYYKSFNILKGIVIPYYKDSASLREIISLHPFEDLPNYYNHDSNEIDNLISLLLEILELISNMYDHKVYYLDIHTGNFLLYNNSVKVIDFEPGHVFFRDRKWNLKLILSNYAMLVEKIRRMYKFKEIFFHSGVDFYNTEMNVKALRKRLER